MLAQMRPSDVRIESHRAGRRTSRYGGSLVRRTEQGLIMTQLEPTRRMPSSEPASNRQQDKQGITTATTQPTRYRVLQTRPTAGNGSLCVTRYVRDDLLT